jgi:hypothetical protein
MLRQVQELIDDYQEKHEAGKVKALTNDFFEE